jgi:nicotinamidase-related amidase
MTAVKRIAIDKCCGVLIDYQDFFLAQTEPHLRGRLQANTRNFVRLLGYFRIPTIATIERPIEHKGAVPEDIRACFGDRSRVFEKSFFDLTKEKKIRDHLAGLKKKQVIVAGCETDVCVLQSCLGLLALGFEVFLVEEIVFSSARDTNSAVAQLKAAGAVFTTYKSLFYELIEAVEGGAHTRKMLAKFGPFPDDLPDIAAE